jgi:hypothetical protein
MKIEPAIKDIIVPSDASKWPEDRAQEWAMGHLAGGPPDIPEDPHTGNKIEWKQLKSWIGKKIRIRSRPKGLIIFLDDGSKRFVPGDTASSKKTSSHKLNVSSSEMRKQTELESRIREFTKNETKIYNKKITKEIRLTQTKTTTYEFWESGKRIRDFLKSNEDINQDTIWAALEQWGRGNYGYKVQWFRYATYFFDWRSELKPENPIFLLSETRIMNLIRASKIPQERDNLLEACISGPLKTIGDSQFKWVTGQSSGTVPDGNMNLFNDMKKFDQKIREGKQLSDNEIAELSTMLLKIRDEPRKEEPLDIT